MRVVWALLVFAASCANTTYASAWDRQSVHTHITEMCEDVYPDDWPGQEGCIASQRMALETFRPPKNDDQLISLYKECKSQAQSEYDFASISDCYHRKAKKVELERSLSSKKAEQIALETEFPAMTTVVTCSFSDGRKLEIRHSTQMSNVIIARTDNGSLMFGRAGTGYSFQWGGEQNNIFQLEGNQLLDQSNSQAKRLVGKCDYR
ncbi:hypothetical protein [Agrobacterium vitis]|uniref:hypothetical protein n=1 Tax=Agrobacterium vitis TaxID=373 RepID=UPI001574B7FF|nr:hypothetical protein [Agrobacterium vitis]NSZ52984.1 hypothetical protein [Agrobacterium vitis]NTA31743.1 hypothetical protein [Agrobacterium vitis]